MVYQGNCCGFNGNIIVVIYCNVDICLSQCWCVVNVVVYYCYLMFFILQMFDCFGFIVWQYFGDYFINFCFFGDCIGGGWVIFG